MKRTVITISAIAAVLFSVVMIVMAQTEPVPGKDGNRYVPYEQRTGNESIVYFTRDLSAEGLIKAYEQGTVDIAKAQAETLYSLAQTLHCTIEELIR